MLTVTIFTLIIMLLKNNADLHYHIAIDYNVHNVDNNDYNDDNDYVENIFTHQLYNDNILK